MRVVVTGGSGQLGTHVLRRLFAEPDVASVVSLDLRPPAVAHAKLTHARVDVRDRAALDRHLAGSDALFHLAAVIFAKLPRDTLDAINVTGSRNAFEAAADAGVTRVVYTSSAAAYGVVPGHACPAAEDEPRILQDDFAYSAGKCAVESFLDAFEREHPRMAIARLRPVVLIGAHMEHPLGLALRHRVLPRVSDVRFPIVWDEDVADAALLAFRAHARGAFNVSADESLTFDALARRTGLFAPPFPLPVAERAAPWLERLGLGTQDPTWLRVAQVTLLVSSERAKRELGWSPRCPTAVDVIQRFLAEVPRRTDPRIALFFATAAALRVETHDAAARVHVALTGDGGGDWTLSARDGRLVAHARAPRPPTTVVTLPARAFRAMLARPSDTARDAMHVEGDAAGADGLRAMIDAFHARTTGRGPAGAIARAAASLFAAGR